MMLTHLAAMYSLWYVLLVPPGRQRTLDDVEEYSAFVVRNTDLVPKLCERL